MPRHYRSPAIVALRLIGRENGWTVRNRNRYPEGYGIGGSGVDFTRSGHTLRVNTEVNGALAFAWLDDQPVRMCRTPSALAAILRAPQEG